MELQKIKLPQKNIKDYLEFTPQSIKELEELSNEMKNLRVTHINATSEGGGVAEMLKSVVPLQNSVGLKSEWLVIPPDEEFFNVTKEIHNYFQGKPGDLSKQQKEIYENYNKKLAKLLENIETDVLIIHDPQPTAALSYVDKKISNLNLWRCHIDTSLPNLSVWNYFKKFWDAYDTYIFTLKEYAHKDFPKEKLELITPVIDPLSSKNIVINKKEAIKILKGYKIDTNKPIVSQISRFDPWKDPIGVIKAFLIAQEQIPELQLVLAGQMADDDPEGEVLFEKVKRYSKDKEGIILIAENTANNKLINALQTYSKAIIQKSTREGFGLTVTEAMWKNNAVIGGNVGGIKLQISDGKNGFLVNSSEEAAEKMVHLVQSEDLRKKIGDKAHISVKNNYLMPHLILNYMNLFKKFI